jgi:hypothetical protein
MAFSLFINWLRTSMLVMLVATMLTAAPAAGAPLQLAIVIQEKFHLEVVAGALNVLRDFSSAPVTVYLHEDSIQLDHLGFQPWMASQEGVVWKAFNDYRNSSTYDLVWFISPEYHVPQIQKAYSAMKPKAALVMVHNGHVKVENLTKLQEMTSGGPIYTLGPHVAKYISNRTKAPAEWLLPIMPYKPFQPCLLKDMQAREGTQKRRRDAGCNMGRGRVNLTGSMLACSNCHSRKQWCSRWGLQSTSSSRLPVAAVAGGLGMPGQLKDGLPTVSSQATATYESISELARNQGCGRWEPLQHLVHTMVLLCSQAHSVHPFFCTFASS